MSQEVDETNLEVNYTYDNRGNISTITNGNVTYTYKYTPFGDLKSISVGDTALLTYTYESNQNRVVTKLTYANGQTFNYSYNDNGMLTQATSKDSSNNVTNTLTYVNDETGETLKTIDWMNSTVTLTYLDETQIWNFDETELLYLYSLDDDSFDEFVNGEKFTTTYSEIDDTDTKTSLTTTETTAFGNMTKTVYSDAFGRVTKEETKNGDTVVLTKEYTYNSNGDYVTDQVKSVKTTVGSDSPVVSSYTYDNNGNITATSGYPAHQYRYDEFNQVIYEYDGSQWLEYTYDYDNGGNIVSATDKSYTYGDEWVDKLTAFNGKPIVYDESGNPISYLGATLTWKNGRQLASYVNDGISVTYKYNSEGLRTEKNVNGTVYKYYWAEGLLSHQTWGNQSLHFYYDYNDKIMGFTYSNGTTIQEYIYNKNTQGDVIGIIDSNGTTVANYSYDALGYCTQYYGVHYDIADINPIRYRGYYYDEEIEMYYLQSRYYDYNTGRFINADDPDLIEKLCKSDMHGTNIFAYCGNNVINYSDPTGYCYYNQNLKWCHDNWEFIGNYKRKKAPNIYNYLYPAYYKINISKGGGLRFKGKAFLKDYGYNAAYVKKVYFLQPEQLSAFIAVLKAKKTIKRILEKAKSKIYDELFDYFKKELGKMALKSMQKYLQIFDYEWAQIIEDMMAFRANINALKEYKKKGKCVMFAEATYDEKNPNNPPSLIGTTFFIIEPWSGKVTDNPTFSNFYLLYRV